MARTRTRTNGDDSSDDAQQKNSTIDSNRVEADLRRANVSQVAWRTTLELLQVPELRDYVETSDFHSGINFGTTSGTKVRDAKPRTQAEARRIFHTFGKELVLASQDVFLVGLPSIVQGLEQGGNYLDDLKSVHHLLVNGFFRYGQETPFTSFQLLLLQEFIAERQDDGAVTHTCGSYEFGVNELDEWYKAPFRHWLTEVNDSVIVPGTIAGK